MKLNKKGWEKDYRDKIIEPKELGRLVHSGERVFLGSCCGEPQTLVEALVAYAANITNVEIINISPPRGPSLYTQKSLSGHLKLRTFFGNLFTREAIKDGQGDYIPSHLSGIPDLFYNDYLPLDIALIQLSPPDEHGYLSFGISVDCTKAAAKTAKQVVAEVNSEMPRTLGNSFIHVSEVDYFIETSRPLICIEFEEDLNEVEKAIGVYVAELVPDGATLALGFGRIVDAVLYALSDKKNIGIHTGSISDSVIRLVEKGVITNTHKTIDQNKIVTSMAMGSERLYKFCHNNPMVEMHPIDYTHNIDTLTQFKNLISINSAFQIDLYGQVNAEMLGDYHIGGTGGQVDFIRGSKQSIGGKSIICLPSSAKGGKISRIVPFFDKHIPVTSLRTDIDYIVTEFGMAKLKGKSLRERALSLIQIAHPSFRENLRDEFVQQWTMMI